MIDTRQIIYQRLLADGITKVKPLDFYKDVDLDREDLAVVVSLPTTKIPDKGVYIYEQEVIVIGKYYDDCEAKAREIIDSVMVDYTQIHIAECKIARHRGDSGRHFEVIISLEILAAN